MGALLLWYAVLLAVGAAAFPLAFTVFRSLPGRGYGFSRALGLLIWGYLYWMLGSLGVLRNNAGGLVVALVILAGLSAYALSRTSREALGAWWRQERRMVVTVEALFLVMFVGWAWIRTMNPEITATEKPMELAFLNSILRSPGFPPNDPWLSGYSISYYYFGYVLVAMLAKAAGTPAGVAFNLGVSLVFALSAAGAYTVVYGLLRKRADRPAAGQGPGWALFGPLFVLLVSNLEGFLDMLHARGLFWQAGPDGALTSRFWSWLNLKDLVNPPAQPFTWVPQRFLWWWRASRVVNDLSISGAQQEVIDEFPFFSFLLSDLHPHVLAIPFVLLAVGLALSFFKDPGEQRLQVGPLVLSISPLGFLAAALALGALAFLNTWDFPIYVALFAGGYLIKRAASVGWTARIALEAGALGALLGLAGVILFFPFYIGFSSQAGGILPNVVNPIRGAHLWVMFGSLFVPILVYMAHEIRRGRLALVQGLKWGFGFAMGLWILNLAIVLLIGLNPETASQALSALGASDGAALLRVSFARRLASLGGWLTIAGLLSLGAAAVLGRRKADSGAFAALMIVIAMLLVIGPEYFYLRDLFSTRMNTIFKFYYQAWILLSLAAAYASARVVSGWRSLAGTAASVLVLLVIGMALVYPVLSLQTKTNGWAAPAGFNLDGTLHGAYLTGDDRAAVSWLLEAPLGTLLEAVGGSYSNGGRIAAHSGQPAVLGWVFHQAQWRGGYEEVGSREADIARIYETANWDEARTLLDLYQVTYIYVGPLERTTYAVSDGKFQRYLPVLFQQGAVTIFGYTPSPHP